MNVGWLVFAAFLSDFLLGVFAWLGLEHASVPDHYSIRHYLLLTFPYSHGLLALLVWAAIAGFLISRIYDSNGRPGFAVVAVVVLSPFVLDGLVHVAGLPRVFENSPKLGLELCNHMPLQLALETLMALAAVVAYWKVAGTASSVVGRYGMGRVRGTGGGDDLGPASADDSTGSPAIDGQLDCGASALRRNCLRPGSKARPPDCVALAWGPGSQTITCIKPLKFEKVMEGGRRNSGCSGPRLRNLRAQSQGESRRAVFTRSYDQSRSD